MEKIKGIIGYVIVAFSFLVFFARAVIFLDPDFGWHLKMGELITQSGFPSHDPFSYTMPSFPFIDHEWFSNAVIYRIYSLLGYAGLALIFTLLVFFTLFILEKTFAKYSPRPFYLKFGSKFSAPNFILLLSLAVFLPYFGVRTQVESWLLLSLLTYLIFKEGAWNKQSLFLRIKGKYIVPIIILFWTNLHGSFAAGLGLVALFVFVKALRIRKVNKSDLAVLALCVLATFINPYGTRLWHEVWMQFSDGQLRWNITEWMPSVFMLDISYTCLLGFSTFLVFRYRKKFVAEELLIYLALLLQAILSRRHVPLWVVVSYPLATRTLYFFYDEIKKVKGAIGKFQLFYRYVWVTALFILIFQSFMSLRSALSISEKNFYPKDALSFVESNSTTGEIFSEYGWGGYLIWKLPGKKVFIDGRMPSWRWKGNPATESNYSFDEYIDIVDGSKSYKDSFSKYNIDLVLWPKAQRGELLDVLARKIAAFLAKKEGLDEELDFTGRLEKDGWKRVYEDSIAVVYKKPT